MSNIFLIDSLKYDGRISKSWNAELIEQKGDLTVFKGEFELDVDHRKLGFIRRGTISYEYYWRERWFNIFRFHEPEGDLRNFYCNVATPATLHEGRIEYIDLDIDVLVDPQLNYEILDLDEFDEHTIAFGYPPEVIENAQASLSELIELIEKQQFPFDVKAGMSNHRG